VEAVDARQEMLGFKRLSGLIAEGPEASAQAMLDHLVRSVEAHSDPLVAQDDYTIAVVRVRQLVADGSQPTADG
jgi:hypothetical protein